MNENSNSTSVTRSRECETVPEGGRVEGAAMGSAPTNSGDARPPVDPKPKPVPKKPKAKTEDQLARAVTSNANIVRLLCFCFLKL